MTKNLTLALESQLLERSREHAHRQGKTLNQYVREYLERSTQTENKKALAELFSIADLAKAKSKRGWTREEIYER